MLGVARVVCILMMTTLSACGVSGISEHHETTVDASAAPVGLATFVRPALGWPGRMYGYIEGWPAGREDLSRGSRGPLFTYAMDFRVVKTNQAFGPGLFGFPVKCVGLRRTYFHPGGARVAFSDPSRFVNGEPVAIDRVEFTVDTTPVWGQVMFEILAHPKSARPFDYNGRTITLVNDREVSFRMLGRYSPQYGGFLLTSAGA